MNHGTNIYSMTFFSALVKSLLRGVAGGGGERYHGDEETLQTSGCP